MRPESPGNTEGHEGLAWEGQGHRNPLLTWSHGVGEGWARVLAEIGVQDQNTSLS